MLMVGCDRETAGNYLGFSPSQLRNELQQDGDLLREVLRAEAAAVFHQIRNLHEATKDSKQWRASVWWLERRIPERFARRAANAISTTEWHQFLETLAEMVVTEISSEEDRQRLLARLSEIAEEVDAQPATSPSDAKEFPSDEIGPASDLEDGISEP